jgi:hypothetical protein
MITFVMSMIYSIQMKSLFWFKHDRTSSLDEKLGHLIGEEGAKGYGTYWYILEMLCMQADREIFFSSLHGLAKKGFSASYMKRIVTNYGLFELKGESFSSPTLSQLRGGNEKTEVKKADCLHEPEETDDELQNMVLDSDKHLQDSGLDLEECLPEVSILDEKTAGNRTVFDEKLSEEADAFDGKSSEKAPVFDESSSSIDQVPDEKSSKSKLISGFFDGFIRDVKSLKITGISPYCMRDPLAHVRVRTRIEKRKIRKDKNKTTAEERKRERGKSAAAEDFNSDLFSTGFRCRRLLPDGATGNDPLRTVVCMKTDAPPGKSG